MITEEMELFRKMLDDNGIEWHDASVMGAYPITRTHFNYRGYDWSVIHGCGSYGGYDFFEKDKGLLELMSNAVNDGDPIGYLTAKEAFDCVRGDSEMTREEAIIQLRLGPGINEDVSEKYNDAVNMAIEALKQVAGKLNNPDNSLLTADSKACKEQKSKLDLIRRQAAIDAIEEITWHHQNRNGDMVSGANDTEHQAWYKADDVYKALEAVPSADRPKGEWIPCSERLPSEHIDVIVTGIEAIGNERVTQIRCRDSGEWRPLSAPSVMWDAWMPLPEPYEERREP